MQSTREHYSFDTASVDVNGKETIVRDKRGVHIFAASRSLCDLYAEHDLFWYFHECECAYEDICYYDSLAECARAIDRFTVRKAA